MSNKRRGTAATTGVPAVDNHLAKLEAVRDEVRDAVREGHELLRDFKRERAAVERLLAGEGLTARFEAVVDERMGPELKAATDKLLAGLKGIDAAVYARFDQLWAVLTGKEREDGLDIEMLAKAYAALKALPEGTPISEIARVVNAAPPASIDEAALEEVLHGRLPITMQAESPIINADARSLHRGAVIDYRADFSSTVLRIADGEMTDEEALVELDRLNRLAIAGGIPDELGGLPLEVVLAFLKDPKSRPLIVAVQDEALSQALYSEALRRGIV